MRAALAVAVFVISIAGSPSLAQEIIDPRTGQLQLVVTDLTVAAGPLTLDVTRTFRSESATSGGLGPGWHLNWESSVHGSAREAVIFDSGRAAIYQAKDGEARLHGPSGASLRFESDRRAVRHDLGGVTSEYELLDGVGRLTRLTDPNGNSIVVHYSKAGSLKRVDGPMGAFLDFTVDEKGRVTKVESSFDTVVVYSYFGDALAEVRIDGGPPERYTYDESTLLVEVERPQTGRVEYSYDAKGRVTSRRWADGNQESYEYAGLSRHTRLMHANGRTTLFRWSDDGRVEETTDPLGNTTRTEFSAEYRPAIVTDPSGAVTRYSYDSFGRVIEVDDGQDPPITYEYLADSDLVAVIHRKDGVDETYAYDEKGNLLTERVDGNAVREFTYTPTGLVESVKGIGAPERRFSYFPNGLLHTQTNAMGQVFRYRYDDRGNLVTLTDAAGNSAVWEYDELQRPVRETNAAGESITYSYDARGLLATSTDPAGGVTRFDWDEMGRLVAEIDPMGRITTYSYGPGGQLATATQPGGHVTRLEYDAAGRLVREVNPLGGETRYEYSSSDRVTKTSDPAGGSWMFEYAPDGTTTTVNPSGMKTSARYDRNTKRESGTSADGFSAWRDYDELGRVIRVGGTDEQEHELRYDEKGNLVAVIGGSGAVLTAEVDALGRTVKARTGSGFEVRYAYDETGNLIAAKDNFGAKTTMAYDLAGRLKTLTEPGGDSRRFSYDAAGRPIELTGDTGLVTRLEYNAAGDLVRVDGPTGANIALEYGQSGEISALRTPAGATSQFESDAMGNLTRVIDPLGGKTIMAYDRAGRLIKRIDPDGNMILFSYDTAGRLTRRALPGGRVVRYEYDATGNVVAIDDGTFPVRYSYEAGGLLTRIGYPTINMSLAYRYDDGRLSEFIGPLGHKFQYEFDQFERLTRVKIPNGEDFTFAYDAKDRITNLDYPNGISKEIAYDSGDRIVSISFSDLNKNRTGGWTYEYDTAGNLVRVQDSRGRETEYKYDPAGRLTSESGPAGTFQYGYSPGGNRIWFSNGKQSVEYRYNLADQLISAGEESFSYDRRGNLVERREPGKVTRYAYDSENRLVSVTSKDGEIVRYGYAPTGERVWREDSAGRTWLVTDGRNVLAELGSDLEVRTSFWHGPGLDRPLMMWHGGETVFYHTDIMGSVTALSSASGGIEARYLTDAFGNLKESDGSVPNPLVFTARVLDKELGLYDLRARVYDPALGRFLSPDPVRRSPLDPEGTSRYAYARNTPTRYSDPTGLDLHDLISLRNPFDFSLGPDADSKWAARPGRAELAKAMGPDPNFDRHYAGAWKVPRSPEFLKTIKPAKYQLTDRRWLALCEREYRIFAQKNPIIARDLPETAKRMAIESLRTKFGEVPVGASSRSAVRFVRLRQQGVLKGPESYPAHWSPEQIRTGMDAAARQKMGLGPAPGPHRSPSVGSRTPTRNDINVNALGQQGRVGDNTVNLEPGRTGDRTVELQPGQVPPASPGNISSGPAPRINPNYRGAPSLSRTRGDWKPIPKPPPPPPKTGLSKTWADYKKPPTANQSVALTLFLSAEMILRCKGEGLTVGQCAEKFLKGVWENKVMLAGTTAICVFTPAGPVVLTALTLYKGVTDIMDYYYTHASAAEARENLENILKSREIGAKINLDLELDAKLRQMRARIERTGNDFVTACQNLDRIRNEVNARVAEAEKIEREILAGPTLDRSLHSDPRYNREIVRESENWSERITNNLRAIQGDLNGLKSKMTTDLKNAEALAQACESKESASKILGLLKNAEARGLEIAALRDREKKVTKALEILATFDATQKQHFLDYLSRVRPLRDQLMAMAQAVPSPDSIEGEVRRATQARDLLTDPSPSLNTEIDNLMKGFGDKQSLDSAIEFKFWQLKQLVASYVSNSCQPEECSAEIKSAADRILRARLSAQQSIDDADRQLGLLGNDPSEARAIAQSIREAAEDAAKLLSLTGETEKTMRECLTKHGLSTAALGGSSGSGTSGGSGGTEGETPPLVEASSGGSGGGGGGGGKPPLVDASKPGGPTTGGDPQKPPEGGTSTAVKPQTGDEELVYANLDIELAQDDYGIYDILDNFKDSEIIVKTPQGEKQYLGTDAIKYLARKGWIVHKGGVGWIASDRLKRFLGIGEPDEPDKKKDSGRDTIGGMTFDAPLKTYNPDDPNTPEGKKKILRDRLSKLSRQCYGTPESTEYWSCRENCLNLLFAEYGKISQDRVNTCQRDCDAIFEQKKPQVCREAEAVQAQLEKMK